MKKDLPNVKKTKLKKCFWPVILIVLIVFMSALVFITHRPRRYAPIRVADHNQASRYLTNQLLPTIYNNSQLGKPFEVVITQDGLNDILARWPHPIKLQNIVLTDPQVLLLPQQIILMATTNLETVDLVLAIELNPTITPQGLMNLHINTVTLGAVNITAVARLIGDKAYLSWMSSTGTDPNSIVARVCRSLLNNEPFEPAFEIGDESWRISKMEVAANKITVLLTPSH